MHLYLYNLNKGVWFAKPLGFSLEFPPAAVGLDLPCPNSNM